MNVDIEDDRQKFQYFESNQSESTQLLWRQDTKIFSVRWMLIGQFKFQPRQPYARITLLFDFCLNFILKESFLLSGLKQNCHSHLMFCVPFPVQKSQSQWIKSHFPTHILGQSQSHFTPSGPSSKVDSNIWVIPFHVLSLFFFSG